MSGDAFEPGDIDKRFVFFGVSRSRSIADDLELGRRIEKLSYRTGISLLLPLDSAIMAGTLSVRSPWPAMGM
jgi:hypothetical protein